MFHYYNLVHRCREKEENSLGSYNCEKDRAENLAQVDMLPEMIFFTSSQSETASFGILFNKSFQKPMYSSTFIPESNVLKSQWQGKITKDDIMRYLDFLTRRDELPQHLYTLEMMEDAEPEFEIQDLADVASKMKEVLGKFKTIRSAVVSVKPIPVAYGMMYKAMTETYPNYKVEIFDAEHLAMHWLAH